MRATRIATFVFSVLAAAGLAAPPAFAEPPPVKTRATDLGEDPAIERAKGDGLEVIDRFRFEKRSARVGPHDRQRLARLAEQLKATPDVKLEIAGHTDDSGAERYNGALSMQRAKAVTRILVEYGVESSRLDPIGYGPYFPLTNNDTEEARARNRRVEIKITP